MSASMADLAWIAAGTALTVVIVAAVGLWIRQEVRSRGSAGGPRHEPGAAPQDEPGQSRQGIDQP